MLCAGATPCRCKRAARDAGTLLIPLGAAGAVYLGSIIEIICVMLALIATSYRQTIASRGEVITDSSPDS